MSYRDYDPVDLARAGFKIHQLESLEKDNIENAFAGLVEAVIGKINDGKEATVYLCQASEQTGVELLAAKIFKSRVFRSFDTDRNYRNFSKMRDRRMAKAMRGRTNKGERVFHHQWIESEWQYLSQLYEAGVRVPRPFAKFDDGLLMEFIGDVDGAAPRLVNCRLSTEQAEMVATALWQDVKLMLDQGVVHGDLSAYNILLHGEQAFIIDMPQAMDIATTPDAYSIMGRDLANLDRYFEKQKIDTRFCDLLANF